MKTVTLSVDSRNETNSRAQAALSGIPQGARITFESEEILWRLLTTKRWALLKVLTGAGPLTLRETARRAGRDVKAVHRDVHALLDAGVLDRTGDGRIVFPFEEVHVDFVLRAA